MKPYVEHNAERLYLPQEVDPHRFEVCVHTFSSDTPFFLLCPVVKHRYRQASGVVLERMGKELQLHLAGGALVTRTFPLDGMQTLKIQIDWSAGGPVTITHEEPTE